MKLRFHFKTPDTVRDALHEERLRQLESLEDLDPDSDEYDNGVNAVFEDLEDLEAKLGRFIRYGESLIVEFDSETGSMTVVPVE